MKTTEVKTSELVGAALDWAVAVAVKHESIRLDMLVCGEEIVSVLISSGATVNHWNPSTDWSQAGPLIEKYKIETTWNGRYESVFYWCAYYMGAIQYSKGPTPLIAAMRAIVSAKLGDVVSVPVELVGEVK